MSLATSPVTMKAEKKVAKKVKVVKKVAKAKAVRKALPPSERHSSTSASPGTFRMHAVPVTATSVRQTPSTSR